MAIGERLEIGRLLAPLPYRWNGTRRPDEPRPKAEYASYDPPALRRAPSGEPLDLEPLPVVAERADGYLYRSDKVGDGICAWRQHESPLRTCSLRYNSPAHRPNGCRALIQQDVSRGVGRCHARPRPDHVGEFHDGHGQRGAAERVFAVWEFLDMDWSFESFWSEVPMATGVRAFIRDRSVECVHPYRPEGSIAEWADQNAGSPADWRGRLVCQYDKIDHTDRNIPGARPRRWRIPPLSGGGIRFAPCVGARRPCDPARPTGWGIGIRVPASGGLVPDGGEMGWHQKPPVSAHVAPDTVQRRESQARNRLLDIKRHEALGKVPVCRV